MENRSVFPSARATSKPVVQSKAITSRNSQWTFCSGSIPIRQPVVRLMTAYWAISAIPSFNLPRIEAYDIRACIVVFLGT
jgi:hypothetical protein